MANQKLDQRVRYTKMVIRQNFLPMLRDRPVNRITVKEVCAAANINRATFYAHYTDLYDLLARIQQEFYDELREPIRSKSQVDMTAAAVEVLETIRENVDLCRVLFGQYGDAKFLLRLVNLAYADSLAVWRRDYPNIPDEQLAMVYEFVSYGSVGIIRQWIDSGMQRSARELATFIYAFCQQGLSGFAHAKHT